jgi:streptomycin 6-kinase
MDSLMVPTGLAASCRHTPERRAWLDRLPDLLHRYTERWALDVGEPYDHDGVSCAWVARAVRADGTSAILKAGMPHMEGDDEIAGLLFWDGDGAVRVLESDTADNVMLLEACEPGTPLGSLPDAEKDVIIAGLLRRLWKQPPARPAFRHLSELMAFWSAETLAEFPAGGDAGLMHEGIRLMEELSRPAPTDVVLVTDLHPGNVLRARREPWLMIDPKPFVGDPAYDATQYLIDCRERVMADPIGTIGRVADLLGVDAERVRLWLFARAAGEPREDVAWSHPLARRLS